MTVRAGNRVNLSFDDNMLRMLRRVHVNMPWNYLPQYLEMVLQLSMNVEIGFEANELDSVTREEMRTVAARLQENGCGVTLHGPFWDLSPGSRDPLVRQISAFRLQQFFDLISIFAPVQVVCHTGYDPRHHKGQTMFWVEKSVRFWEPLVERAEDMKVNLLIENVWEDSPGFHLELLSSMRSRYFGFCLDVGHQHTFSAASLSDWLEALSDYLMEIHLHDNDGSCDAHLPIGDGDIDFPLLFGFLKGRGLKPIFTLEPHKEEHLSRSLMGLLKVLSDEP